MNGEKINKAIEILAEKIISLETSVTLQKYEADALRKENANLKAENGRLKELLTPTKRGTENE